MYYLTKSIRIHERADWHARSPKNTTPQGDPHEAFIHHGAESDRDATAIDTQGEMFVAMRGIQNYHMDNNGWSDIAYHYVVFQPHGKFKYTHICEGRMVHHVPAAQLGHNTGTLAVCIYGTVDHDDPINNNTIWAISQLLSSKKKEKTGVNAVKTVGGHRDVVQTSCPGDMIYRAIPRIAQDAGIEVYKK